MTDMHNNTTDEVVERIDPPTGAEVVTESDEDQREFVEKVNAAVQERIDGLGEYEDDEDASEYAAKALQNVASDILGIIEGTDDTNGYYLIPRELGRDKGPDISAGLCAMYFDINS